MKPFSKFIFYENSELNVGINTFSIKGIKTQEIYDFLLKKKF